uniref:Binding-protein-dependent transport systems inner membrane component n=1 Tax=uncultured Chloroflexota bacterium TaxID=166587 RepID=H5SBE1_9CHLR|nr:binding-protein-dependent transport systems inner membrane component [uncultured Chloroflexota bacterium]BAL55917.1 binding-protein-dependent transport systems inner membrane component [uncultured Chloroflexota bacterium]
MKRWWREVPVLLILLLTLVIVVFPYFWTLLASFKNEAEINRPLQIRFTPTLKNWQSMLFDSNIPRQIRNSILAGGITVTISLLLGAPAAYAFSRFRSGGNTLRFVILLAQMLPPAILIVPFFLILYQLRMLDSLWGVITTHLTFIMPLMTWFLIGFFEDLPRDLEEQAMVDGCTRWQAFYKVVLPVIRPALGAAALFGFILSWNDLFYALLLTSKNSSTLPVGIASFWTFRGIEMGRMSAAIVLAIVPVTVLSFFIQSYLVRGLGGGALKG